MRIEQSKVVKAPREQVFQEWTDYEAWPRFSVLFTKVTVTERAGNTVHLDTEVKRMGRKARRKYAQVLRPPEQAQLEGEKEGHIMLWKFETVPAGTLVTFAVEIPLKGLIRVLEPLGRRPLQGLLRKELQAFAKQAEAKHAHEASRVQVDVATARPPRT